MKNKIIFSLSQNLKLVQEISNLLSIPVGEIKKDYFQDGEVLVKTNTDVEGKDVILVESTSKRAQDKMFELMLLLDSLKRSKARSVQVFIPYFGYSRQERSYFGEPVSCEVVAKILETADYDELLTMDVHHPVIESFFKKPFRNIMTTELFKDYYLEYFKKHYINKDNVAIVAPDHGSNVRVDALVKELGVKKIILDKVRPEPNVAEHLSVGNQDIKNKTCIILDDIIDTGGTIVSATKLLYDSGAKEVLVGATHAVFSSDCVNKLFNADIKDLVVTNTIEHDNLDKRIHVLDIYPLITKHIK